MRFVSPSEPEVDVCILSSERLVLSCEISKADAEVCWYRDGMEVEENDNLILEDDGTYRRLKIPCATIDDSAEYVCETADDSITFWVKIEGTFCVEWCVLFPHTHFYLEFNTFPNIRPVYCSPVRYTSYIHLYTAWALKTINMILLIFLLLI